MATTRFFDSLLGTLARIWATKSRPEAAFRIFDGTPLP